MSRSAVEDILDNASLPMAEKMVLIVIARHGRGLNGSGGYPSLRLIAMKAGCGRSKVDNTLRSLEAKGILTRISGGSGKKKVNVYDIHPDKVPQYPSSGLTGSPLDSSSGLTGSPLDDPPVAQFDPSSGPPVAQFDPSSGLTGKQEASTKQILEANKKAKTHTHTHTQTQTATPLPTSAPHGAGVCESIKAKKNEKKKSNYPPDEAVLRFFNWHAVPPFKPGELTPGVRKNLHACWHDDMTPLSYRRAVFAMVNKPFLRGENPNLSRPWKANFAWLFEKGKNGKRNWENAISGFGDPKPWSLHDADVSDMRKLGPEAYAARIAAERRSVTRFPDDHKVKQEILAECDRLERKAEIYFAEEIARELQNAADQAYGFIPTTTTPTTERKAS